MIPWLEQNTPFPEVTQALTAADGAAGLLAAGADLSVARLLEAYARGIFPWFSAGQPILWWSPDPRMVLYTEDFSPSRSLQKTLRHVAKSQQTGGAWQVRHNTAFTAVVQACAAPRGKPGAMHGDTWISAEMQAAYHRLHLRGYAHSVETWYEEVLVGGLYGVCLGRMFYGESMFAHKTDASKIALAYLVAFLKTQGVAMIDCQQETPHLASLGARPIPRATFLQHVRQAILFPKITQWTLVFS